MKSARHAGNVNLRGRKTMMARCGCCVFQDFRDDYRRKMDEREIREAQP